jgi:CRP-like cAMP-binding protein
MAGKAIQLKAKEPLFEEGDQSKNMYFLKNGQVRIFKRKGEGSIEIETIRSGQIIGELAFLDGQARSASAEALTSCELIEISREALDAAFKTAPDWLSTLIKTITARLRNANNRIRVLESVTTDYEVDKYGNRSKEYTYLTYSELMKFVTAVLLTASRYGKPLEGGGVEFSSALLERFASQVLQVPAAKVVSLTEIFKNLRILSGDLSVSDLKFFDQLIAYLNDQNLLAREKQQSLTSLGFKVLSVLVLNRATAAPLADAIHRINLAPALKTAGLQAAALQELLDQHLVKNITLVSENEVQVDFDSSSIGFLHKVFWIHSEIDKLNAEKRKA